MFRPRTGYVCTEPQNKPNSFLRRLTLFDTEMPSDKVCPDCDEPLERMSLQGTDTLGELSIVSESTEEGFLGNVRANEILTPIPYVCPECRRTVLYAEK